MTELATQNPELATYLEQIPAGFNIPMANLGSGGMFIGILSAFFAVEVYRFTQRSGFKISMPEQVPASVARSFEALTPTAIILIVVSAITMWMEIDVHGIIATFMEPLISASDSLGSVLLLTFLTNFFWIFGIHGASIVGSLARPLWLVLLEQNTTALAAGEAIQNTAPEPFYQWFIYIGGAGATIGLALLLAVATKSTYGKTLGKTALVPAIFNINEPLIFGAPVVLNPTLMIPFTVAPMVNAVIAWYATEWGFVSRTVASAPWTLPGPIGAFLSMGNDWRAAVLNIVLTLIAVLIYYPFVRTYDNQLLAEEQQDTSAE